MLRAIAIYIMLAVGTTAKLSLSMLCSIWISIHISYGSVAGVATEINITGQQQKSQLQFYVDGDKNTEYSECGKVKDSFETAAKTRSNDQRNRIHAKSQHIVKPNAPAIQ